MLPHDPTLSTIHTTSVDDHNILKSPQVDGTHAEILLGQAGDLMQKMFHEVKYI